MTIDTIYISIGLQCTVPTVLERMNLRKNSYPFDWMFANPYFVYKILYLLLKENLNINEIVREHFFRNDQKCGKELSNHYMFKKNGKAICNELYNAVFPHDKYNEDTINKYIRRFERLKNDILNTSNYIQFIYISQPSLNSGNFTLNGKEVIQNVYQNMNNIYLLVKNYNKNINIMIFDAIKNEDTNILNNEINLYKISQQEKWTYLVKEVINILSQKI